MNRTKTASLRLRVVVGVLALLCAALVGLGVVVNAMLGERLHNDLRQRLSDRAGLAQALLNQGGLTRQQLLDRLSGQGVIATMPSPDGTTLVGAENPAQGRPPGKPQPPPKPRSSAAIVAQGDRLTATVKLDDETVTLTASQAEINRTLHTLRSVELVAGGITLVLAALLVIWIVAAALAPLDRMTALARRIRDGTRGRRLRPTRPTTEIGRTALAFDDMLDALETAEAQARSAEARMRQFLADASHDLRTPVAGVIASAERVLRENPDRRVREQQLVALIREARRAARLVDDVVLMSRLDAAEPSARRAPVDMAGLVRTAAERSRWSGASVHVTDAAPDATVSGDRDQLDRVVTNLIDNARRHAPASPVEIAVRRSPDEVVVEVADHGPGVGSADRERIFDRFVRLDEHRGGPGAGLGLPIARAVAMAHGGTLSCVDRPDGASGAAFRIVLPAASAAERVDDEVRDRAEDVVLI